jgi:transposase
LLDLITAAPTPQALHDLDEQGIAAIMKPRSPRLAKTLPSMILAALDAQTVAVPGTAAFGRVITGVAAQLRDVRTERDTLAAYAGLAPVTRRSGSSIKGETRSQRGNHALKSALFLSAFASLADPTSRAYYDRKRAQGKRHNAALICLARRRVDVIYAMLRDRKPYTQPAPTLPSTTQAAA